MHIVVSLPDADAPPWLDLFHAELPNARIELRTPGQPADAAAVQADYVIAACQCNTLFTEQTAPKAVFTISAGVAHVLRLANAPRHVPLLRIEDAGMAPQMVRYTLAVALRVLQRLDVYARQQRDAHWQPHDPRNPAEFAIGVLGLGVIGAAIARALAAQEFAVRGFARTPKYLPGIRCHAGGAQFDAFLDGLDMLVCVVPATVATQGILNRRTLSRLARGAHVVNLGRGAALVDGDLLAMLDSGHLGGATLDVFGEEPLPSAHPFWRRPDITVTPHMAGLTLPRETVEQIAGKIARLERGETVTGVVDYQRGY